MTRSIADWRKIAADWRRFDCVKLADDLDALLDTLEALAKRLEDARDYALDHSDAEEADRLRRILWPAKT